MPCGHLSAFSVAWCLISLAPDALAYAPAGVPGVPVSADEDTAAPGPSGTCGAVALRPAFWDYEVQVCDVVGGPHSSPTAYAPGCQLLGQPMVPRCTVTSCGSLLVTMAMPGRWWPGVCTLPLSGSVY